MFITLFLHIFQPSLHDCNVKLPNFTHLCMFSLFFLNLDTVLSSSNWIRSTKVETVQTHFLSDVFSLLSSRSFATMTRWFNIFSLLMTMDNCNGLFFGMQMYLGKKPLTVLWKTPQLCILCLRMGKNTYCSSLSCFNCLSNYWCAVLNSRCFIFLFSVDLFWIMFHPLIPRTNKRWVLLLWFI